MVVILFTNAIWGHLESFWNLVIKLIFLFWVQYILKCSDILNEKWKFGTKRGASRGPVRSISIENYHESQMANFQMSFYGFSFLTSCQHQPVVNAFSEILDPLKHLISNGCVSCADWPCTRISINPDFIQWHSLQLIGRRFLIFSPRNELQLLFSKSFSSGDHIYGFFFAISPWASFK